MIRLRHLAAIASLATACRDVSAPDPASNAPYDLLYQSSASALDNQPGMFLLADGAPSRRVLLVGTPMYAAQPRVSADGRWVAYIGPRPEDGEGAVWLATTDGVSRRQVFTTSGELLSRPAPSPDGTRVAFQATDETTGSSTIWIVNADGSNAHAITTEAHAAPFVHTAPAWSPDGTQVALAAGPPGSLRLATMSAEGGPLTMRTEAASGSDTDPFWSPDGTQLVFTHTTTPALSDIEVLTLAGGARRTLYAGNAQHPAWSPRGLVVFSARVGGEAAELYVVPAEGGLPFRVTTNDMSDRHPNWVLRRAMPLD